MFNFFTDFFNDGRDFLPMYFARGDNSGSLYLNIASPYRQRAVSRYIRSKGAEGLPEEEVEEMELFSRLFRKTVRGKITRGFICCVPKRDKHRKH